MELQPLFRTFDVKRDHIDEEARTVELSFSSELPVERHFGMEVLDHSPNSVDLGRLNDGGAVLVNHDTNDQVGVVERAEITADRVGRAIVRFGKSTRAQEVFQDIVDGIRRNVSVGYRILEMEQTRARSGDSPAEFRATRWLPFEVSTVPVPADGSVGVGRNDELSTNSCEVIEMADEISNEITEEVRSQPEIRVIEKDNSKEVLAAERARTDEINSIGERFGATDLAREFASNGKSADEFKTALLGRMDMTPVETPEIGLTDREAKRFSFVKAIRALSNPHDRRAQDDAAFEFECSRAAQERSGQSAQGILVPWDVLARDLSAGTDTAGGFLVATDLLAGSFIDALRNRMVVAGLGATVLDGLVGDVAIPRLDTAVAGGWISTEGGASTEVDQVFGNVSLAPKDVGCHVDVTRRLIQQSTPAVEGIIRDDVSRALAIAIDKAALDGSGAAGQPTGIKNQSGVNSKTFGAAAPTHAELVDMESLVAADNADMGALAYVIRPNGDAGRGFAKTTLKSTGVSGYIWEPGNTINGYNVGVTNQVVDGDVFFGNFNDLLMGFWGGLDILVDPYTASNTGTVRVNAIQTADIAVRHPESFCIGNDGV